LAIVTSQNIALIDVRFPQVSDIPEIQIISFSEAELDVYSDSGGQRISKVVKMHWQLAQYMFSQFYRSGPLVM